METPVQEKVGQVSDNTLFGDSFAEKHREKAEFYAREDEETADTPQDGPFSQSLLIGNDDFPPIRDIDRRFGNVRGWASWWWRREHKMCARCKQDCKQSWRVKIIRCPQFEAKDGK